MKVRGKGEESDSDKVNVLLIDYAVSEVGVRENTIKCSGRKLTVVR